MKSILYISNIEVPYRTKFFNEIAEKTDLTVLYEREKSSNRDEKWTKAVKSIYKIIYLKGINGRTESSFNLKIIKYVFSKKYNEVVIGCYNSPSQILAMLMMRLFHRKYILNIDGEYYFDDDGFKGKLKRFLLKGADKYFVAGNIPCKEMKKYISSKKIFKYNFSSLTAKEIMDNAKNKNINRNNEIVVIGQYFDYKGLDIALACAAKNKRFNYKFIGSGYRSNLLQEKINTMNLKNVKVIPFLQSEELKGEYQNCFAVLLPSKKECWGLVINEAASFGTPIVSTYGSGAAREFLEEKYPQFLAKPNDPDSLYDALNNLVNYDKIEEYKEYLIEKSKEYTIEENGEAFLMCISDENKF